MVPFFVARYVVVRIAANLFSVAPISVVPRAAALFPAALFPAALFDAVLFVVDLFAVVRFVADLIFAVLFAVVPPDVARVARIGNSEAAVAAEIVRHGLRHADLAAAIHPLWVCDTHLA